MGFLSALALCFSAVFVSYSHSLSPRALILFAANFFNISHARLEQNEKIYSETMAPWALATTSLSFWQFFFSSILLLLLFFVFKFLVTHIAYCAIKYCGEKKNTYENVQKQKSSSTTI